MVQYLNMKLSLARSELPESIQSSLIAFLGSVPGLSIERLLPSLANAHQINQDDLHFDLSLALPSKPRGALRGDCRKWRLQVKYVRYPNPASVEAAAISLARTSRESGNDADLVPVLFAPYLSPAVLSNCAQVGVSCVDAAGNGRIVLDQSIYIERSGLPDPNARRSVTAELFVPKAERVLRVLLNAPGALHRVWRIQPLAAEACVSVGQVARVKAALLERELIAGESKVRRQGGFRLTHPGALLEAWGAAVRSRRYRVGAEHTYNALESCAELRRLLSCKLPASAHSVALSGLLAAEQYAPYVVSPHFTAYVVEREGATLANVEQALNLQAVETGVNVVLTVPRDEGVLYLPADLRDALERQLLPLPVSPVQAYLDMLRLGGRSAEGAQHLLETYLRPRWQQPGRGTLDTE